MKKVLILGGSHRDIPLIKAAKELGFFVSTLGDRDYYLGHKYSDKAYKINFNDIDVIKSIIKTEQIDYLLPGCGEESYLNTVKISQELNIGNYDSLETAQLVHNKWKFKEFCLKNKISTPKGFFYNSQDDLKGFPFPLVVKPTNLSGGRGVEIVKTPKELQVALNKAKEFSDEIFLEEFIEGELIAYSIFIKKQKIIYGFVGKDNTHLNKYLITSAYPIKLESFILQKLQQDIEKLSQLLSLVDGMFHLQVLVKNDVPYIIDVTRRIPGDFYPNLIEFCDEVNYSKAVVKSYSTGELNNEFDRKINTQNFVIRHCVMPNKNGVYKDLFVDASLKNNIIYRFDLIKTNTPINDFLHSQISIIFIKLEIYDVNVVNNINRLIYPIVEQI